jgi:hypothetical protein
MSPELLRYQHSVIIAPRELFDEYLALKKIEPSLDMHLYTLEEMEACFAYQSDDRALVYLLKKGQGYQESLDELRALRFVQDKTYANPKLQSLCSLSKELQRLGLLYRLPNPERLFEKKNILIAGYHCGKRISNYLGELHNMAMGFDLRDAEAPLPVVNSFKSVYDELSYLYNRIAHDLDSGTDISSLYVYGLDPLYDDLIHEFNRHYGFQIEENNETRLFDSSLYHDFASLYLKGGLETALSDLEKATGGSQDFATLYRFSKRFAGIFEDPIRQLSLYDEVAKATPLAQPHYRNVVRRLNEPFAPKDSHLYLVNFTMGVFPSSSSEDPYLFDEGMRELDRPTSLAIAAERYQELSSLLSSGRVESISFKKHGFGALYYLSGLANEKQMKVIEEPSLPYDYSKEEQTYLTLSLLDQRTNFLYSDPRLAALLEHHALKEYRSFDYRYTPFRPFQEKKARSYSPTALKSYFACPFAYYLERVLGLRENAVSFPMRIGFIFHALLSDLYQNPAFEFESEWNKILEEEAAKNGVWSPKESALFLRLHDEAMEVVAFYRNHDGYLKNLKVTSEQHFKMPLPEDPLVSLEGQYDKIVSFGEATPAFAIIDYKTGGERFEKELVPYGLSLQLPFYAYYALHEASFEDRFLVGLFIGPLLSGGLYRRNGKESNEKFNNDKFKLEGLFTNNTDLLLSFDPGAAASSLIRSCRFGEKGFYKFALPRVKSPEDFAALSDQAKTLLLEADCKILAGDFPISPIVYKKNFDACQYCDNRDICFRKDEAVRYLPEPEVEQDEDDEEDEKSEEEGSEDGN